MFSPLRLSNIWIFSFFLVTIFYSRGWSETLTEMTTKFIQHSPRWKVEEAKYRSASEDVLESRSLLFPKLSLFSSVAHQKVPLSLTGGFDFSPHQIYALGIEFSQPIYSGGRIWKAYSVQKLKKKLASHQVFLAHQKSLADFLNRAIDYYVEYQRKEILKESYLIQKDFYGTTQKLYRRGAAKSYQASQAQAEVLAYESQMTQNEQHLRALEIMLRKDIGEELRSDSLAADSLNKKLKSNLVLSSNLEKIHKPLEIQLFSLNSLSSPEVNSWGSLNQDFMQSRPDVQVAQLALKMEKLNQEVRFGENRPSLSIGGRAGYQNTGASGLVDENSREYSLQLKLSIPIFSGLSSFHTRKSGSEMVWAKEKELAQKFQDVRAELEVNATQLLSLKSQLLKAQEWEKEATEALRGAEKDYRLGTLSQVQIVQLQKGREQAVATRLSLTKAFYSAWISWQLGLGHSLEEEIKKQDQL